MTSYYFSPNGGGGGRKGEMGVWRIWGGGNHIVFQENGEGNSSHQQSTKEVVKEIDARLSV